MNPFRIVLECWQFMPRSSEGWKWEPMQAKTACLSAWQRRYRQPAGESSPPFGAGLVPLPPLLCHWHWLLHEGCSQQLLHQAQHSARCSASTAPQLQQRNTECDSNSDCGSLVATIATRHQSTMAARTAHHKSKQGGTVVSCHCPSPPKKVTDGCEWLATFRGWGSWGFQKGCRPKQNFFASLLGSALLHQPFPKGSHVLGL